MGTGLLQARERGSQFSVSSPGTRLTSLRWLVMRVKPEQIQASEAYGSLLSQDPIA